MIIVHATTVWMLDDIQSEPVRLTPFPRLVNEFNWNKECPLVKLTPRVAFQVNTGSYLELQGSLKRANGLGWKQVRAVSAIIGTQRTLLGTGELV